MPSRVFAVLVLALFLCSSLPAIAQEDLAKSWGQERSDHLAIMDDTMNGPMQQRRETFLQSEQAPPQQWWDSWKASLPYDNAKSGYSTPMNLDIPASPDLMSNSPYGRNIAKLVYSQNGNAATQNASNSDGSAIQPFDAGQNTAPDLSTGPQQTTTTTTSTSTSTSQAH